MVEEKIKFFDEWIRWARLGCFDIKSRYRRTLLGPLWIVLLTGMTVGSIGFVYGSLFKISIKDFLPYVAIGMVTWVWISTSLIEASTSFSAYKFVILNQELNPSSIVIRVVVRNWIILLHNSIVIFLLFLVFGFSALDKLILFLPGMLLVGGVVFASCTIVAFCCARFCDLQQMLSAFLGLGFLVTPVIWTPDVLGVNRAYIAQINPITHYLSVIRSPLLGVQPSATNWLITGLSFVILTLFATMVVRRFKYRVPFWV